MYPQMWVPWSTKERLPLILDEYKHRIFEYVGNLRNSFSWKAMAHFLLAHLKKNKVKEYILNQEEHHQVKSFRDEFIGFLKIHEIEYDEKYLWK